ncbi:hypothetical protein CI109_100068 [Kwoniella shandongensis]|uniref:Uncharacterized protein n=1 Tax=Kwoniella shandongensis TaxID=1734106 RepID=A0A5M6BTW8_9TREE|nr:uncharacterized protein CI109_005959 [Kwoniella shandongensis]KAA5525651.1 hypothetical protein CI109_005959 [Kwoniella shandongensis]
MSSTDIDEPAQSVLTTVEASEPTAGEPISSSATATLPEETMKGATSALPPAEEPIPSSPKPTPVVTNPLTPVVRAPSLPPPPPPPPPPQELELAPLPQTFDPDQELPPPTSPADQIVVDPFGVGNPADDEEEEQEEVERPLMEEGKLEEEGEDQMKMMEYITSIQQFGGDGDPEGEMDVEMEEQIVVDEGGGEEAQVDQEQTSAVEDTAQVDGRVDKDDDDGPKVAETVERTKESEVEVQEDKDAEIPTAPSSPLTPMSDLPELPDTLALSPVIEVASLPNQFSPTLPDADSKRVSPIPHAESSAAAARRNSSSPQPDQFKAVPKKTGIKRARETNGSTSTRGKGKRKSVEVIEIEDDLRSISAEEEQELIEIKPDEKSERIAEENGKRKSKKAKGPDGTAARISGPSRKRLDATLGISRDGDKAPEKIAPRPKGMTDALLKKNLQGKTREIQMAPCLRPRYAKWGKCTQCIAKIGGDSCRFRDYRVFSIDPETSEITGPGWFESTEWKEEMTPLPTEFNVPLDEKHIQRTERTVAPMLLPLITREVRHVINKKAIKRGVDTAKHRALCDFCSSTIFGGWFFCKRCGRDYCLHCERYFPDSLETMSTSPWPLPDAARPRLLRCHHPPTAPGAQAPRGPAFHTRSNLQPVSRFGDEELRDHWLALAEFVLEEKDGMEERLKLMGLQEDDEVETVLKDWTTKAAPLSDADIVAVTSRSASPQMAIRNDTGANADSSEKRGDPAPQPNGQESGEHTRREDGSPEELISVLDLPFTYTKTTHPTANPIPDPAGLEDASRDFMFIPIESLDNKVFDEMWSRGEPVVVDGVGKQFNLDWTPDTFIERFGDEACFVLDCQTNTPQQMTVGEFFELFQTAETRGKTILKLKDWPSTDDFQNTHPELYNDFCDALPVPDYTRREGVLNLYAHFPPGPTKPDIGPKMYNAFEAVESTGGFGSTRLHMDVADAINVMLYASPRNPPKPKSDAPLRPDGPPSGETVPKDKEEVPSVVDDQNRDETVALDKGKVQSPSSAEAPVEAPVETPVEAPVGSPIKASSEAPVEQIESQSEPGCAVWDLFRAEDSDLIREFLKEKFDQTHKFTDPIHSQLFYLDAALRKELWEKKGVVSWRVYQYPGQAVFIPAGCAHQVCNLADCIKIALDFVSPHNVRRCQALTQDFRKENFVKAWKEDVLQLYNVLWYAWQSCRETRVRRKQEEEAYEAAQAARAAHLASLRSGDHESYGYGRYSPAATPGLSSETRSGLGMGMGLGGWNVSSVRDEPHAGSRSPSVSRGGSPGPTQQATLARVLAESRAGINGRHVNHRSNGDVNDGQSEDGLTARKASQTDEAEERAGETPKETAADSTATSSGKIANPKRDLAHSLLQITLTREETNPRETFVPSTALWGSAKKVNLPSTSSRDIKPVLPSGNRSSSLSMRQKEAEKREKERLERKFKNPVRPLRTSTLIKLGARRVDEVLGMAMGEMGTGDTLGGVLAGLGRVDEPQPEGESEVVDGGSPMTEIMSFGGENDEDQAMLNGQDVTMTEEDPTHSEGGHGINDIVMNGDGDDDEDEEQARANLVAHLGELAKTAPDDDGGEVQVDMEMFM